MLLPMPGAIAGVHPGSSADRSHRVIKFGPGTSVASIVAELAVVGPPRVGAFSNPAQPEPHGLFRVINVALFTALDVEATKTELGEPGS
jgi:hypothetical protein